MEVQKIEKLDELLKDYLKSEKTVIDHDTSKLTAMGENYGSIMLALKILLKHKSKTETLEAVAKIPPPGAFIQKVFNTPVTFRNEINFYKTILPELNAFLHEKGINGYLDCFSEFLGSRVSLQPNKTEVDDDAVILLKNLKVLNYEMLDRTTGFDLPNSKVIIEALAKLHTAPLAFKLQKPEAFKKIRSLFKPYNVFEFEGAALEQMVQKIVQTVEGIETCKQYTQNVLNAIKATPILDKNAPELTREPFATIIHTDAWVNNFMLQYHEGSTRCKIVDFQFIEYGSPARDLVFFLFTSVQIPVMKDHYEELIGLYHRTLVEDLKRMGCNPAPFSREELDKEMELVVKQFEFFHLLMMLEPVFATKEHLKELDQYDEEYLMKAKSVSVKHLERAAFIVQEFVKRKWI